MSWPRSLSSALRLRPLRFLAVGFANTALGLAVIYIAKFVFAFNDVAANATGYAFGLLVGYGLNSTWTFDYRGRIPAALARFAIAFLLSYGLNLLAVWFLIKEATVNSYIAQALGIMPYTLCFYLLCRSFVFPVKASCAPAAPPVRG
jgi:putative flippase GtrA